MKTPVHHLPSILDQELAQESATIVEQGQWRSLTPICQLEQGRIATNDHVYLNLVSNDYLGLAANRDLLAEFYSKQSQDQLLECYGPGSTGSRLLSGNSTEYTHLEQELSAFYASEAALVFNSGYHLNIGILPALSGKNDLVLADKLCHASLIDGLRLCRAKVIRYPHLDYENINWILTRERNRYRRVFLVTESIFSMDGDAANLAHLAELKDQWKAVLYVDEAHGVGVRGARGQGLAEEQNVRERIDIFTGTFGKAFGGQGAFVIGSQVLINYLVNTVRPMIFTTGLPPVTLHWLRFVLQRIPTMHEERNRVAHLAEQLRASLRAAGLRTHGESNIVPVLIGDAAQTVHIAQKLAEEGYWVRAVRPPTVPLGSSRLRLSLNAAMDWQQLAPLADSIARSLNG